MPLDFVGEAAFELLAYATARLVLPLVSFGRVRAEPVRNAKIGVPRRRWIRTPDGRYILKYELVVIFGLLIWAVAIAALVLYWHLLA